MSATCACPRQQSVAQVDMTAGAGELVDIIEEVGTDTIAMVESQLSR